MPATATSLGYALLGLVHQHEHTGYALAKFFEDSPMGIYSSSPGAIYPALKRLEEKGLVRSRVREDGDVKRAKVYSPTPSGTEALREWLTREITKRNIEVGMNELMLRFAFHEQLADPDATRRFLADLLGRIERYLEELEAVRKHPETKGAGPHARLALEGGMETYRVQARWARRAMEEFETLPNGDDDDER